MPICKSVLRDHARRRKFQAWAGPRERLWHCASPVSLYLYIPDVDRVIEQRRR